MALRKTKPTNGVSVKVDPALKRQYDALVAAIESASAKEARDFDVRWEAAARIVDDDLYIIGGFKTPDEFYRKVMNEEPRNARRYVRVAKFASAAEEQTYGVSKLDAALGLIEAKLGRHLEHPPLPVAFERLRIDASTGTKSLAEATVQEINRATSKLTTASRKKPKTHAQTALGAALATVGSLKDVVVRERAGFVSFERVPLAAFRHFVRAISAAKLKV